MILPRILDRERCKVEGMNGNLLQNTVFKVFALFLDLSEQSKMGGISLGQIGQNYASKPREIGQFSGFSPIFPLVPTRIAAS